MKKKLKYILDTLDCTISNYGYENRFGYDIFYSYDEEHQEYRYEFVDLKLIIQSNSDNENILFSGRIDDIKIIYERLRNERN